MADVEEAPKPDLKSGVSLDGLADGGMLVGRIDDERYGVAIGLRAPSRVVRIVDRVLTLDERVTWVCWSVHDFGPPMA